MDEGGVGGKMEGTYKERVTRESVDRAAYWTGLKRSATFDGHAHHYLSTTRAAVIVGGYIYCVVILDNRADLATKRGFRGDDNRNDSPLPYFSYLVTPDLRLDALLRRHGNNDMNTLTVRLSSWKANPYLLGTKGYCVALSNALKESMARLLERHLCNNWRGRQLFRWPS